MRYLRLYGYFLRFSFSRAMEFRLDFFFRIVMDCVFYAVNLAFFAILFRHTSELGGLTLDETYIFVAGYLLLDAINMTVFSNNLWMLPFLINRGDLDYYLVRPVSSLFFLSLRDFAANSFVNLLIATGILVWALLHYPGELDLCSLLLYFALLGIGSFLHYSMQMIFTLPVFWLHRGQGLRLLYFALGTFAERPHPIYTGWWGRLLRSVLPFALIVSYPTYLLLRGVQMTMLLTIAIVVPVWGALLIAGWSWGLRNYSSASS